MLKVKKLGIVLAPTKLPFESQGVLNPACFQEGKSIHLFYRAIDKYGRSSIGYAKLKNPTTVLERWVKPIISRKYAYEKKGVEDPRIVKIGNTFYLTYVAHDGKNALTAYASGRSMFDLKKRGLLSPRITYHGAEKIFRREHLKDSYLLFASFYEEMAGQDVFIWHKDVILFPKKINGRFAFIHRVLPDIQIAFFKNFKELRSDFWKNQFKNLPKNVILQNKHWFESRNIGGGAPPIETKEGWLLILHTVEETNQKKVYHASAALLDKNNPRKVIGKLHEPLFSPTKSWERAGVTSNVVFPTGTALFGDTLYIYYGAADKYIAAASVSLKELLAEIKNPNKGHGQKKR